MRRFHEPNHVIQHHGAHYRNSHRAARHQDAIRAAIGLEDLMEDYERAKVCGERHHHYDSHHGF